MYIFGNTVALWTQKNMSERIKEAIVWFNTQSSIDFQNNKKLKSITINDYMAAVKGNKIEKPIPEFHEKNIDLMIFLENQTLELGLEAVRIEEGENEKDTYFTDSNCETKIEVKENDFAIIFPNQIHRTNGKRIVIKISVK